jgi:5,10-methylenetetrahydromethanopterin reductase
MKFGFGFVPKMSLADSARIVQAGESLGYSMAWVPDQTFYRDPFLVLASWAQATTKIELMVGVTNPYTRHPAQVARSIATLDEMAHGRAHLGVGAGNRRELLLPMGHEQTAAAERCREMVILVRDLVRGETVHHRSEYIIADGIKLQWIPLRANIPLHVAARGALTLEVAGEVADGAIIGALVSPAGLDYAFEALARGAARSGRSMKDIMITSWVTCIITDNMEQIEERLKASISHIIGGAPVPLLTAMGLESDYVARLKAAYGAGGPESAARLVSRREIDMLSIVGSPDEVRAKIARLEARGVDQIGILISEANPAATLSAIERIANEIMPTS